MPNTTSLWKKLQSSKELNSPPTMCGYTISADDTKTFLERINRQIETASKCFAKAAHRSLDALSGSYPYKDITTPIEVKAALVIELFRNSSFISNSCSLEVVKLHEYLIASLSTKDELTLEIGWGQAKRDAGLLRTMSADADLSELIAIARLKSLIKSIEIVTSRKVNLRVITGGSRFSSALFIRKESDKLYNLKRKAFSSFISPEINIVFDTIDSYWSEEEILSKIDMDTIIEKSLNVSEEKFRFALFSIDWYGVIGQGHAHGITIPSTMSDYFKNLNPYQLASVIRFIIAFIANPDIKIELDNLYVTRDKLLIIKEWFIKVSKISAELYEHLGIITPRNPDKSSNKDKPIILTVVQKKHRPDIPCIQLLGSRYNNTLPQHMTGCLVGNGKVIFDNLYLFKEKFTPFFMPEISNNPMGVSIQDEIDTINNLKLINIFEDIEIS